VLHVSAFPKGHHQTINTIYKTIKIYAAKFLPIASSQIYISIFNSFIKSIVKWILISRKGLICLRTGTSDVT
jgi:hypothetical protein